MFQFDDFEDDLPMKLERILEDADKLRDVSRMMTKENRLRKRNMLEKWCDIIKRTP